MAGEVLGNLRVVESGSGVAAPFCARLFADYGADVIKLEPPEGDPIRAQGPFPQDRPDSEKSGLFFALNTNKRSAVLDLTHPEERERLRALLRRADVWIDDHRDRQLREWGIDWESASRTNPRLVMISITPFGSSGPYADWKGADLNAYHLSAAGSRYCGQPDRAPLEHGTFSAEYFGAYVAATWGLACVWGERGRGQHIDVSCAEAIAALFVGGQNIGGLAQDGIFERRTGIGMPLGAPATILPCKDGHVWMMALETGQWRGLCHAMGDPEWAAVEIFDDMFARAQNADVIYPLLEAWTREHTKEEIMDLCQANGCPTTALFTVEEVANHPHLAAREFFTEIEHPVLGSVRMPGPPIRLSHSPAGPARPAPLLGQHQPELASCWARPVAATRDRGAEPTRAGLPLAGVRVANFGWGWLGPVAGQTLARLGAEVYKIESRARVDINRTLPPFGSGIRDPDRSLQNHAGWGGNGSVTIDLKKQRGRELARQLVTHCDVMLENFGPGVMSRLELDYEHMRVLRPDLVMVSMPAAGLFGPLANIRTYGMSLSSITGLDSVTGYAGGPPVPVENAFADPLGGVIGALAALLGLHHRARSGEGQHVDFSQQEGLFQLMLPAYMDWLLNGRVAGPIGNRHPLAAAAPHGVFRCRGEDRWIALAVQGESEWRRLVTAMGSPAWANEARFADRSRRTAQIGELHAQIESWTRTRDDYALAHELQDLGLAATPVLDVSDLLRDPHYQARRTFAKVEHPLGFEETLYGNYVKCSGEEPPVRPGPTMGQDNEYVFRELLGIPQVEYRRLIDEGVLR